MTGETLIAAGISDECASLYPRLCRIGLTDRLGQLRLYSRLS